MAGFAEYEDYDVVGLAELIAKRAVSPEEILDAAITRIEARNPALNAVTQRWYDDARAAIAAGLPEGPLRGVPFLLKDLNCHVKGKPSTNGSRIFKDYIAEQDSTLVERYRAAGLVLLGKTNTSELGLAATTEPALLGPARNPWNTAHSTGGSSGGSAAAVAARMVPAAHATDGGGSIRVPSSCCGVFGLKPTRGRLPMGPMQGEGWAGLSHPHAVTLSVRDSAALLDATHGPALGDPYAAPTPPASFREAAARNPGKLRIGLMTALASGAEVHAECVAAAQKAAALCESFGHSIEPIILPFDPREVRATTRAIMAGNIAATLQARAAALGRAPEAGDVETITWKMAEMGLKLTAADYAACVLAMHRYARRIAPFFAEYDAVILPTMARLPLPLGILNMGSEDIEAYTALSAATIPFTPIFNVTGQPSASIPLHWSADGLPVGVQVTAAVGQEARILAIATQLEAAAPWFGRKPPIAQ